MLPTLPFAGLDFAIQLNRQITVLVVAAGQDLGLVYLKLLQAILPLSRFWSLMVWIVNQLTVLYRVVIQQFQMAWIADRSCDLTCYQ